MPAKVVTLPKGVMRLMALKSRTKSMPLLASAATAEMPPKLAAEPVPSAEPEYWYGEPARVLTAPRGEMLRMAWLESLTDTVPVLGLTARPLGLQKLALAPGPSAWPGAPEPASLLTAAPCRETLQMALEEESAANTEPPCTAMPKSPYEKLP
jgi:hypothetical protein